LAATARAPNLFRLVSADPCNGTNVAMATRVSLKNSFNWLKLAKPLCLLVLAPLTMAPKCGDQVVIPSSDNSKPTIEYWYRIDDGTAEEFPDSGDLDVEEGHKLCVYMVGNDPQGLKSLEFSGSMSWVCEDPNSNLGMQASPLLHGDESQAGKPGDKAYTGIYLDHCFQTDVCGDWILKGAGSSVRATAKNFHGKQTVGRWAGVNITTPSVKVTPKPKPNPPVCPSKQRCCEPGQNDT
jgi:hypothetical protein